MKAEKALESELSVRSKVADRSTEITETSGSNRGKGKGSEDIYTSGVFLQLLLCGQGLLAYAD